MSSVYQMHSKWLKLFPSSKKDLLPPNYKPISVLSPISRIFVKLLYTKSIKYIDKSNLLFIYQFVFRKKKDIK